MSEELVCWKCGTSVDGVSIPFARLAECPVCAADLHVCRMCAFYDTSVARSCREPVAEDVADKTRANFCGYFQAQAGAYSPPDDRAARVARAELDALFGKGGAVSEP
ncbi:MAG TPA: hypothetical protein VKA76_00125, partial [Gammaproteobacteria bacterium]|nr:hypothetical protein [Gammaproteobacteria bacterium]